MIAAVITVLSINHPLFYGFVASLIVAGGFGIALDRRISPWVAGYIDAEVDPMAVVFPSQRRAVWLAVMFLGGMVTAGFFFVATLLAGVEITRFYSAYGVVVAFCIAYAVWALWTVSRWVEVRLDAEGVSASGPLRRAVTIPWSSVVTAFAPGQKLVLATVSGPVEWPVRQLLSDPDVVAEIITRCSEVPGADAATARAVIDSLIAEKRPLR
ncbi:hypothetical protein [Microbacterium sp. MYb62]|uniref:hypothetical protein n=1 Tax=Microbacterium sp. MYb62 TaxID=1848690 RepID=UPI0011B09227|nr:hypothetical protein [Microbacterium sp. MYb62]